MDIATIAMIALPSVGVGGVVGSVLRGRTIRLLRSTLSAREATIAESAERIAGHVKELAGLRGQNVDLCRKLGRANAELETLRPLADRGKRAIASQLKASQASAAKRAASVN